MKCLSCKEDYYGDREAGTCRECYEEAGETEEELKREIDELKSKVNFLRLLSFGTGPNCMTRPNTPCFSDVVLVASGSSDSADSPCSSPSIPAPSCCIGPCLIMKWRRVSVAPSRSVMYHTMPYVHLLTICTWRKLALTNTWPEIF